MANKKRPVNNINGKAERPSKKTTPASQHVKPDKRSPNQKQQRKQSQKKTLPDHARDLPIENEETYQFLVNDLSNVIWRISSDYRFTYISSAIEHQWGYKPEEVIGRPANDFMTPDSAACVREIAAERLSQAKQGKRLEKTVFEVEQVCKNGRLIWVEIISNPIYDPDGRLTGFQGVTRDITKRKQVETALRSNENTLLASLEKTERLAREMATIANIGRLISSTLEIDEVYERFVVETKKLIPFDRLVVNLHDPHDENVRLAYVSGEEISGWVKGKLFPLKGSVSEIIATTRKGLYSYWEKGQEIYQRLANYSATVNQRLRSLMAVPLIYRNEVIGSLHFRSRTKKAYDERDLHTAERIGEQIAGAIGSAQLFFERRQEEEKLKRSLSLLKATLQSTAEGILVVAENGRISDFNEQFAKLWRMPKSILDLHDDQKALEFVLDQLKNPEQFITKVRELYAHPEDTSFDVLEFKDGRVFERYSQPQRIDGKPVGRVWSFRDVTERTLAQKALKASEEKYKFLVETTNTGYVIIDGEGKVIDANAEYIRMSGHDRLDEIMGRSVVEWTAAYDQARNAENVKKCFASGDVRNLEIDYIGKHGRITSVEVNANIMSSGDASRIFALCRDITDRKQAEEKIRQNEQFIRNILDSVDEGFIVIDRDYRILTANKAYCGQVSLPGDDIIGKHCFELSHSHSRPCYEEGEECVVRQVFATGEPHEALHKHMDHDGKRLFVETKGFPIKDASGNITSVIESINNITEKYLLEEERIKTQKLESIGTLAGGIAHDFNNLLQGIFGYISMAKMMLDQREKSQAMLEQAEKALHQSVNLTTQLLTFAKGGKPIKKLIDLRQVIENAATFTLSGSRCDFHLNIPGDLWKVEADEGQLAQVIQNIVLNADQAMPIGGTVWVTAANMAKGDASLPHGLAQGDYVMIAIQDTGVGIPEQYLSKIFDPYFTTKEKGSGLGLATSYSIVKNHGGMINLRTKSGEGSTFRIYLPAVAEEARVETTIAPVTRSLSRTAKVLVMDDEQFIRNLSRDTLRVLGHSVEVAQNGQEALEIYQGAMAAGKPFDIVILDLTIRGGMGGLETIQKLLEIDPAVKAIVSSGYSDDVSAADYEKQRFKAFLKKPYNVDTLREVLDKLLA